jgi:tripartite-type tricarboxylate transporter receptor subunit TctC
MKFPRRRFLHLAAGAAALPVISRAARAQSYPTKTVRIVVGWPAGGGTDITARLIGQLLSERTGQSFLVENRPGAGGNIATEAVVRAAPDGYTLLLAGSNDAWNASLYDNLTFNFVRDIAPVASIIRIMGVVLVHPSFPSKSITELIAYAKTSPGKITVASGGVGSAPYFWWALFKSMTGVDMLHVPYRGEAPALTDMLGGQVQVIFGSMTASMEYVKAGKLRPLAVTSATRFPALPEIPTISEYVPGYETSYWFGVGVPKNTPAEIIDKLNQEINAALADPKFLARLPDLGGTSIAGTPSDFGKLVADETERWGKVIRAANIKAE